MPGDVGQAEFLHHGLRVLLGLSLELGAVLNLTQSFENLLSLVGLVVVLIGVHVVHVDHFLESYPDRSIENRRKAHGTLVTATLARKAFGAVWLSI
jgi:uncharacterized membrane protein